MRETIQFIHDELIDLYPKTEIRAFSRLILEHICGLSYTQQILLRDIPINKTQKEKIVNVVKRLKNYEPVQYILGETEFLDLKIRVTPAVLIPRPETEELVQWVAETVNPGSPAFLDAGTGSGCIALGIKKMFPEIPVFAFDNSAEALTVARENASLNNLEVNFFQADILHWQQTNWPQYGVIVCNPPYVRESEKEKMRMNVLNYEPKEALFVDDSNPLIFYRKIAEFASLHLIQNGWLFFEINENLGSEIITLVKQHGFHSVDIRNDLSGKNRMLRCRK